MASPQIAAFLAALAAADPAPAPGEPFPGAPAATVAACPRPLPPFEVEGRTLICGRLPVPVDPSRPEAGDFSLSFAVLRARTLSPAPDPVVHLHGGPGGGVMDRLATEAAPFFERYRDRRDVIVFDQRGAGLSAGPALCAATLVDNLSDFSADVSAGAAPVEPLRALLPACLEEVAAAMPLDAVSPARNAQDAPRLARALGYDVFNLHGISYGARLALEVLRDRPPGLRAVVLDGVPPPDVPIMERSVEPLAEAVQAMLDQCAADAGCAAAYPDLADTLAALPAALAAAPVPGRPPVGPGTLLQLLAGRNDAGFPAGATGALPRILTEFARGERATYDALVSGRLAPRPSRMLRAVERAEDALRKAAEAAAAPPVPDPAAAREAAAFDAALLRAAQDAGPAALRPLVRAEARLTLVPPAREALVDLVERHFVGDAAEDLTARVRALSDAGLAALFASKAAAMAERTAAARFWLELSLVACRDFLPFNTRAGHAAFQRTLDPPLLAQADPVAPAVFDLCEAFPPQDRRAPEPVRSDAPVLLLAGLNDVQTAPSWADHAAATLSRATVVRLPETGHGTLGFSACARDLAAAFLDAPEAPPDAVCAEALRPRFLP